MVECVEWKSEKELMVDSEEAHSSLHSEAAYLKKEAVLILKIACYYVQILEQMALQKQ